MKKIFLFNLLMGLISLTDAQEKPPMISSDYASVIACDTIMVNVLLNDWCMEGHEMKIFHAYNSQYGEVTYNDSTITYSAFYSFEGTDSIRYMIKDLTNGLISQPGNLFVTVDNPGKEYLDINNINAMINAFGIQFWSPSNSTSWFKVPKEGKAGSVFSFGLWMGGLDGNDQLHLAAERYRQNGPDFSIGPVSDFYVTHQMIDWNKLWKLNRSEIEYHKNHWMDLGYEPIENIINWPAHGNIALGQDYLMAPFNNADEYGSYDPALGDYPVIRGDQAMYMVYNDDMEIHNETGGRKIGVEIHGMPYAFDCPEDSVFNQSIFFHFDIINRSDTFYHDFYLGSFVDFDLGNFGDDFIGCDTILNSFFIYNGDPFDENDYIWNPDTIFGYGSYPPAQALAFLRDNMTSFIGFTNTTGLNGDPNFSSEYYNNLTGLLKDGSPITVNGDRFMFPGDPLNLNCWTEISSGNTPGDRRGLGASGPYEFGPGDTLELDLAFVFAQDYNGDNLTSVSLLKERIEKLKYYFDNDSTPCSSSWSGIKKGEKSINWVSINPNPVGDYLNLQLVNSGEYSKFFIYDVMGQMVHKGFFRNGNVSIDVHLLEKGFYIIEVTTGHISSVEKFIKY